MSIEERISFLEEYKRAVTEWNETHSSELRSFLNQNKSKAVREVIEAGCYKTLTISPPPAVGGMIMQNVDVFDAMFQPPWLMNLTPQVLDMRQTFGPAPDYVESSSRNSG